MIDAAIAAIPCHLPFTLSGALVAERDGGWSGNNGTMVVRLLLITGDLYASKYLGEQEGWDQVITWCVISSFHETRLFVFPFALKINNT